MKRDASDEEEEFRRIRLDTLIGMGFSNLIAIAIIITTAATLHAKGVTDVQSSAQAAEALKPIAGQFAEFIFALGIVGTGLLAIPVLAGSTAYAIGEGRKWPVGLSRKPRQAIAFYSVLALSVALGVLLNFTSHRSDQGAVLERRHQWRFGRAGDGHADAAGSPARGDGRTDRQRLAVLAGLGFHRGHGPLHPWNGRNAIHMSGTSDLGQDELRSSRTPWKPSAPRSRDMAQGSFRCEVLVIGAGITGALVAERLTREGRDVVVVDRETPTQGSTLASTAMLLWEIDRPLGELVALYGYERAVRAYRASLAAVRGLIGLVSRGGVACELRLHNSLYLAAEQGTADLVAEAALRSRAGLPSRFLDHARLREHFGVRRAGAILSGDAADADPAALAGGLLEVARKRGARLRKGEATVFDSHISKVTVGFDNGSEAEAQHVVLATGYVMPAIVRTHVQQVSSSWAIATVPQPQDIWPESALIWEASEDYHYARTTSDGRIIFGGEDDRTLVKPEERDARNSRQSPHPGREAESLVAARRYRIDYQWTGTFDTTRDGLPLIGPIDGMPRLCAAYGYGGNGITFSYLAAHLIATYISGGASPLLDDFAIGRDAPKSG